MNGKRRSRSVASRPLAAAEAQEVAVRCLGRLAADPERLERFLALTGLSPDRIREASREAGFPVAVLDHVLSDEGLLLAVADEIDVEPDTVLRARFALAPPSEEFG